MPTTDKTMTALLETIEIETTPAPTAAVIWLHGLGADGSDFVPIVRELDLSDCPGIRFVFPTAGTMPVTINGGYVMRAWYDILERNLVNREDEASIRASQVDINALIEREIARGIPANKIVLAGFSQGCAMTLQTGLRYPAQLAGLLCLSGYAPLAAFIEKERHAANQSTPIFIAHGQMDPVVALERAEATRDLLQSLGYSCQWKTYPMQHGVCAEEVSDIAKWLSRVLA
jgi:phospholipase/carboxylesterase